MHTGPPALIICQECGASNYATSTACWMCRGRLPPGAKTVAGGADQPLMAEIVYSSETPTARQGSSLLAITMSTLAIGLSAAVLCAIGIALQIVNGGGGGIWDERWMLALFVVYVLVGGLLATAASLAVTPRRAGWNPTASFAARFTLSSLMLVVLFPMLLAALAIAVVIALFITCLSGGRF